MSSKGLLPGLASLGLWVLACSQVNPLEPVRGIDPPAATKPDAPDAMMEGDGSVPPSCDAPSHIIVRTMPEGAQIKPGWSGVAHNIGIPDNVAYAAEIGKCDDECRVCSFRGPVRHPDLPFVTQRCLGNSPVVCSSDEDCGSAGPCRFFYGAGVDAAVSAGGIALQVCVLMHFEELDEPILNVDELDTSPLQGTVDLVDGTMTVTSMNLRTTQNFGTCNYCIGDSMDLDGHQGGHCEVGFPQALCDTQARDSYGRGFSLDCKPFFDKIGTFDLQLGPLKSRSVEVELDADQSPDCGDAPGKKCWCGICDDPPGEPCMKHTDCNGTCQPAGGTKPDACEAYGWVGFLQWGIIDQPCNVTDLERNSGSCTALVRLPDFDLKLERSNTSCFGGDGAAGSRLKAIGKADPFDDEGKSYPTLASIACVPPSGTPLVDLPGGLPGVGVFEVNLQVTKVGGGPQ